MKKLLMIALGLMALTGCTDEHYWDAEYIIEKYCSVASECHQSFSGCYDSRMEKYEKILKDYPECRDPILDEWLGYLRSKSNVYTCMDWSFSSDSEYIDRKVQENSHECQMFYYDRIVFDYYYY